jgi:hypothetical protein
MLVKEKVEFSNKPKVNEVVTTVWNEVRMAKNHSIRAVVREILNLSNSLDVVKVNIIGTPSTGKTTLGEVIQHLVHKMARVPYTVRTFGRDDLLDFEETLKTLTPTNHVLLFDDISFLTATAGKRQIDKIQKAFTEIRHLEGGKDVKIIAIFNFHYNMAVSKYMRQSDFFFWTSVGSSEMENTQNIVGKMFTSRITEFRKMNQEALTKQKYAVPLGKKGKKIIYTWRKPFAPILFWNNSNLRIVVSPSRKWIDPICSSCSNTVLQPAQKSIDLEDFDKKAKTMFGERVIRQALRIKLFNMGVNTYAKRVKQCMSFIDQFMSKNIIDYEQIIERYGLRDDSTRLPRNYTPPKE